MGVAPVQITIFETRVRWAKEEEYWPLHAPNLGELIFGYQKGQASTWKLHTSFNSQKTYVVGVDF